jgi:hypothetical protein
MTCAKCGSQFSEESRFCPGCGVPLGTVGEAKPINVSAPSVPQQPFDVKPRKTRSIWKIVLIVCVGTFGLIVLVAFFSGLTGITKTSPPASAARAEASKSPPAPERPSGLSVFFPELHWGEPLRPDMTPVQNDDKLFSRPSDDLVLAGRTPLKSIHYLYLKNCLSYIEIVVSRTTDQMPVVAFLVETFGKTPKKTKVEGKEIFVWPAGDTMVSYGTTEDGDARIELRQTLQSESGVQAQEPRVREQKQEQSDVGPVFTAELTCEAGGRALPVVACFLQSSFKVRRGNRSKVYAGPDLMQEVGDSTSVRLDLPESFEIRAQNSAAGLQLRLQITQNSTKKTIFEDAATQWGWILIKN